MKTSSFLQRVCGGEVVAFCGWAKAPFRSPPWLSGVGGLINVCKRKKEPELIPFYLSRTSVMVSRSGRHLSMEEPGWGRPSGTVILGGVVGEAGAAHCT